jgi:hypothetical protein
MWCITNSRGEYWHDEYGWVVDEGYNDSFSLYTDEEHDELILPLEGKWLLLY